jgi:adenylate cyclase
MGRFLFPSFPREFETEFSRRYNEDAAPVARIALMFGVAVYLAFYVWDRVVDIDNSTKTLMIRILVVALAIVALSLPRRMFVRNLQLIMVACITVAGLAHAAIMTTLRDGLLHGIPGVVLILMYNFVFFRLLFLPSLITGIIITAAHEEAVRYSLPIDFIIVENFFIVATLISGSAVAYLLESLFRTQFLTDKQLNSERMRTNELIESLFPARIAERLKAGETCIAESHGEVSVLFSDLVGFTSLTKKLSPGQLVDVLSDYFSMLDQLTEKHEIEKIKTIGDAYMVVSGLTDEGRNTAEHIADFALEMVQSIHEYAEKHDFPMALRVGISTGQVISGVIGLKKPSFDLWGETVNLASRMESHSEPGYIQVSEATYWRLHEKYDFARRGTIDVKGVGKVETFFLLSKKAERKIAAPAASAPAAWPDDTRAVAMATAIGETSGVDTAPEPDP